MSDTNAGGAPAGWYEDGVTAGQERYWDGTQWTEQFRPLAAAAPVPPPPPPPADEPSAATAPPAPPAPEAPTAGYPEYQPAPPAPRAPGQGLSRGAIIGIVIAAAAVVVAAIVLILGFTVWGWGGGPSSAQQAAYLEAAKSNALSTGADYSDAQLLDAGRQLCSVAARIDPNDLMGSMQAALELGNVIQDPQLYAIAGTSLRELCPADVAKLEELGQSFQP